MIQSRLKDAEDPLQIVIVKDMMLTGFDAPPLHTLYLDRPMSGALLMQTLARVNRTFRGKPSGLLVAYAPIADDLAEALAEYTERDQSTKPVGRNVDEAELLARALVAQLDELCAGYDWRHQFPDNWIRAAIGLTNYLRSPAIPGNQPVAGHPTLGQRFRQLANQLARAWALAAGSVTMADLRQSVKFYEEVRVWLAKFDAQERQAAGQPVPAEIERLLSGLVASSTGAGDVLDIYEAAGMPKPSLSDLGPTFAARTLRSENPHLAIEALRDLLTAQTTAATRGNLTRSRAFSEKLRDVMNKYTNAQLTSAEVIAELIELAAGRHRDRGCRRTAGLPGHAAGIALTAGEPGQDRRVRPSALRRTHEPVTKPKGVGADITSDNMPMCLSTPSRTCCGPRPNSSGSCRTPSSSAGRRPHGGPGIGIPSITTTCSATCPTATSRSSRPSRLPRGGSRAFAPVRRR